MSKRRLEECGDITLDLDYWDCECPDKKPYIHSKKKGNYCPVCGVYEEDMPDSRVNEVDELYDPKYDTAVKAEYEE